MSTVKLYGASIVLLVWAGLWSLGAQSAAVMIVCLLLTAFATAVNVTESNRRHRR